MCVCVCVCVSQVIEEPARSTAQEDQTLDQQGTSIRRGIHTMQRTASDEDSDFD